MPKFLKALLISAAVTGAAAVLLKKLDLDAPSPDDAPGFPGMNPDDMSGEDVEMLLNELASHLS